MLRKIAVLAVLVVVIAAAFASAATLNVSGGTIQAGVDESVYCDVDGVFVDGWGLETDDNTVRSVRIGGIDGACVGNDMFVRITDGDGTQLYYSSASQITAAGMKTFSFASPYPAPEDIEDIRIWIEGSN